MGTRWARRAAIPLVAAAVLAAGCASGSTGSPGGGSSPPASPPAARPSSTARLAILSPKNGQVVNGSTVKVELSLKGARIVAAASQNLRPDQGHVHILLDGKLVSMNYGLKDTIDNLPAGTHILRAEFVANDHAPFDPRVFTEVTFTTSG